MTVGMLGMAFKADSDDPRESLSYKLRKVLEYEAAEVLCTDVYIQDPLVPSARRGRSSDRTCSFVGAPHREYRAADDLPTPSRSSMSGTSSGKECSRREDPGHRLGRVHRRLPGRGAARRRARGRRARQLTRKYGPVEHGVRRQPATTAASTGDAKDVGLLKELLADCDHFVAGAAIIGGITLFHELAYDLIAENERITAAAFDAAIDAHRKRAGSKRSPSSRRRWSTRARHVYPTPEGEQRRCPPPQSTYGFQKLATEYFAQGAWEQYGLPYTIVRPFNCIGIGEKRALSRHGGPVGQRQAGDEPRRPRPGPEGAQGPGPAAHPRRRPAGPPLHLRRRPGARHPPGHRVARGAATRTSTSRRPSRRRCWSWPS